MPKQTNKKLFLKPTKYFSTFPVYIFVNYAKCHEQIEIEKLKFFQAWYELNRWHLLQLLCRPMVQIFPYRRDQTGIMVDIAKIENHSHAFVPNGPRTTQEEATFNECTVEWEINAKVIWMNEQNSLFVNWIFVTANRRCCWLLENI